MSEQSARDLKSLTTCQRCGKNDPNLNKVDSALRLTLSKGGAASIPTNVCTPCLKEMRRSSSHGTQLQAKEESLQKQKEEMWRNRTSLVKKGRSFLKRVEYAEAAMAYEKYLKIVEVVSDQPRNKLDPKHFHTNPKEITIMCSVFWDLMLIYDSNAKFQKKHYEIAGLLARFLRYTPIYNTIIRKAEKEIRKAKNPGAYKELLRLCDADSGRCFVANAAFETRLDPTVQILCQFRDQNLKTSRIGRFLVCYYYLHSPRLATSLNNHPMLKGPTRLLLRGVAFGIKRIFPLQSSDNS